MAIARKCVEPFESVRVPRVPFPCVVHMSAKQCSHGRVSKIVFT